MTQLIDFISNYILTKNRSLSNEQIRSKCVHKRSQHIINLDDGETLMHGGETLPISHVPVSAALCVPIGE